MSKAPQPDETLGLDKIVLQAAGLQPAEREIYLGEIAASEPRLASEARRRIAAAETLPDSFLDTPAASRLERRGTDDQAPPATVALPTNERYELGEQLGEGGMGRVLKAFDHQLGRPVALKFLTHQDPATRQLFLREARAQARVEHPNVLEIYDSGELDGQPFIAMRYVAGGTLDEVATTLPFEYRTRLLIQVAEGLHAAHREGLLHGDVKPSNVLVERTADGDLKALVTDFGLAAEIADEASIAAGALAGSPHYIAPERLAGEATIDRRSDVYSLGITMYRLFVGSMPHAEQPTLEILRCSLHDDLPPPRHKLPSLPVELEAIILSCTAREPGQRYASAHAVAVDLKRYLDGEVVDAYAAGIAYRLTRFALRNKVLVAMASAAAVAMLVASIAVAIFALRADDARQRAELRQGQAEELIRFMVVDLRDKLASLGRLDVLDEVGGAATAYFAAVPEEALSEEELLRHSRVLYQIGNVRMQQGDLAGSQAPMEQSLALAQRLVRLDPNDSERLFELGQSHFWVGLVRWEQGNVDGARGPFEAYLAISQRLVEMDPSNRDWKRELSYSYSNLGSVHEAKGDYDQALAHFHSTLALDRELIAAEPDNAEGQSELAATHNTIALVLQALGRLDEAAEHLWADLKIRQTLVAQDTAQPSALERLGASHGHLGRLMFNTGELQAASEHFQRMLEITDALVTRDPTNTTWRSQLAWSHLYIGRVAFVHGDSQVAKAAWQQAESIIDQLLAIDATSHRWQWSQATVLYHFALLQQVGGEATAINTVRSAVAILEQRARAQPTDLQVHRWLSRSYLLLGVLQSSPAEAQLAFQRAADAIGPLATGSMDGRALAPWAEALRCLGSLREGRRVAAKMDALGYLEPNLGPPCDKPTAVD